jgi:hypothetical protein
MDIHQARLPSDNALLHSLSTIQAARTQLHLLTASNSTPTALVSQVRLCDVLPGGNSSNSLQSGGSDEVPGRDTSAFCSCQAYPQQASGHPTRQFGKSFGIPEILFAARDEHKRAAT